MQIHTLWWDYKEKLLKVPLQVLVQVSLSLLYIFLIYLLFIDYDNLLGLSGVSMKVGLQANSEAGKLIIEILSVISYSIIFLQYPHYECRARL